jgi:hypothetical protein
MSCEIAKHDIQDDTKHFTRNSTATTPRRGQTVDVRVMGGL